MTTVYFVRHAESDRSVRDGRIRPLTEKGMADRRLVTDYLADKKIDTVLSSPFKRAVDTIADFAEKHGLAIEMVEDFRERRGDGDGPRGRDEIPFIQRQWADFTYTHSDGETLAEVQQRNIAALRAAVERYKGKSIAIGTHGMALSTILHFYDDTYGFADFMAMKDKLPWVVKITFDGDACAEIDKIDLRDSASLL